MSNDKKKFPSGPGPSTPPRAGGGRGRKQLFLSHTWSPDEDGRNTHERARMLTWSLQRLGWTVWFDEVDMKGRIDAAMSDGIEQADAVVMLLTRKYARKINHGARNISSNDNCLKEFGYSFFMQKLIVPVVFEPSMLNQHEWSPGILPMRLSMDLYVDGSGDDYDKTAADVNRMLLLNEKRPLYAVRFRERMIKRSRSTPTLRPLSAPTRAHPQRAKPHPPSRVWYL